METKRNAALGFIFVTVLLDMLAFGIIVPILPKLISEFLNGNMARSSEYMGLFVTTWALMQFFFSPILGMLSDRYGRRPVILLSNFGLGAGLRGNGAGAYARMAVSRADPFGDLFVQHADGDGIHQRRDAAGEAG
jgi:MFS family permease